MKETGSFVICDSKAHGYPIRYVSKGFEELFGYDAAECAGKFCGELIGGASLLESNEGVDALKKAAADAGLSEMEAAAGVKLMTDSAAQAVCRAAGSAEENRSSESVLLMNRRKSGELFVCEMAVSRNRHPSLGWSYYAGAQRDVTENIPVGQLLQAAAKGPERYDALCQSWRSRSALQGNARLPEDLGSSAAQLHSSAEQMWKDDLAKGVKLSDGKVRTATAGDVRSVSSRSTACTLRSTASSQASGAAHHLGALFSAAAAKPAEELAAHGGERLLDLLEGADSDDCNEESADEGWEGFPSIDEKTMDGQKSSHSSEDFKSVDSDGTAEEAGSQVSAPNQGLQETINNLYRQSLRCLEIPLVIAAPSGSSFPVVLCSQGFETLTGRSYDEIVREDLRSLLGTVPPPLLSRWRTFCDSVLSDDIFKPGCGFAVIADGSSVRLPDGELSFVKDFIGRSGKLCNRLVYLKQVELDDDYFVVAMQAPLIGTDCSSPFKIEETFDILSKQVDEVIAVLGSEFMYSASMRRQVAVRAPGVNRVFDMLMKVEN